MTLTDDERRERQREASRRWRANNPEKARLLGAAADARWRERNPERAREKDLQASKRYYEANHERIRAGDKQRREASPIDTLLRNTRARAKQRGRECTLTLEDVTALTASMVCSRTGLVLQWGQGNKSPWAPSLDRQDNARGYTRDNVELVCWAYNRARGEDSHEVVWLMAQGLLSSV